MKERTSAIDPMRVVLWGATGQAKVLRDCLRHAGAVVAAVCDRNPAVSAPFDDAPLLIGNEAFESWLEGVPERGLLGFLVAIGGDRGRDRLERHDYLRGHGLQALTAIHPTAYLADRAAVGEGSQILTHAAVCADATIGRCCIINTAASVDHECDLGEGVHVAPGARLGGEVRIGRCAMVGIGAVIAPRVTVGADAIVGAGAVVLHDVPAGSVVVGNPARILRQAHDGGTVA